MESGPDLVASLSGPLSVADYHRLARAVESGDGGIRLEPVRVGVLSTFTFEFVRPFLVVEGARQGLRITPYFGPFGQLEQQAADPGSPLRDFGPELVLLAARPEDIAPDAVVRYFATQGAAFRSVVEELSSRLTNCIEAVREWSSAGVLVGNFAEPRHMPLGLLDANVAGSLSYALAEANARLRDAVARYPNVAIWDLAGLARRRGLDGWSDPRLWALARVPVATAHQPALAAHLARTLCAMRRTPAKCLVLDLDNTLWGGVIGDDGLAGIQLGDDFPGRAYKDFQRHVLALSDRGVLLAVASKNEADIVEGAFREHPEMVIKWDDLAAVRVNWRPKSETIREIAAELNIGSDQIVLFDDNPVERAEVRLNAPEVLVLEVPGNPLEYIDALAAVSWFDQTGLSNEDRQRTTMYRQEQQRRAAERRFASLDAFLASLKMVAEVGTVSEATLGRVAQLVAKTNQFNLTTARYSQSEIAAMGTDPRCVVAWLRLADRFGDQGLVSVGILRQEGPQAIIEVFLMSCRVMNRQVERAMMAYLLEHARARGCQRVIGKYLPTRKNAMVADFYPGLGFAVVTQDEGQTTYALDLGQTELAWPELIERATART